MILWYIYIISLISGSFVLFHHLPLACISFPHLLILRIIFTLQEVAALLGIYIEFDFIMRAYIAYYYRFKLLILCFYNPSYQCATFIFNLVCCVCARARAQLCICIF